MTQRDSTDRKILVMLVDDMRGQLQLMERRLGEVGFEVVSFDDRDAAVRFLEKYRQSVDIIVSDLSMGKPGLETGVSFIERIRRMDLDKPLLSLVHASGHSMQSPPNIPVSSNGNGNHHEKSEIPVLVLSNYAPYVRDPSSYVAQGKLVRMPGHVKYKRYSDNQMKSYAERLKNAGVEEDDVLGKEEVQNDINRLVQAIGRKLTQKK